MDLVKGSIGTVGAYDLALSGGKLVISVQAAEGPVGGSLSISLDSALLIKAIESKVGNVVAKQVLDLIAAELAKV